MSKQKRRIFIVVWLIVLVLLLAGALLIGPSGEEQEALNATMRDAVLHEENRVSLFGLIEVNPALISAFTVTGILLVVSACIRIFVIPRFQYVPGRFQMLLEELVNFFDNLAKSNSPHRNRFLSVYIFAAGIYIFVGTFFELFGVQAITTSGRSVALPAPLSDINGAICMGCLSYLIILSGGIASNGLRGVGLTLKEFSLPISMSFRLFGALLSGLLVTELVYYALPLSIGLPVIVGLMFTLLHALIQTYVLIMLTALFYGEVTEPHPKKTKPARRSAGSAN
ncbi:MAG TPA: F0F1 ATP synthase subunit A [Candidatus Onthomonas avicola]|nr:F0F1 ATP synthase subunit A [Candidatus Onthomonas avicola]